LGIAWRNQSGMVKSGRSYIHLAPKGSPDIVSCIDGKFISVETKILANEKKNKNSDTAKAQTEFKQKIEACRGIYIKAYSLPDFLEKLQIESDIKINTYEVAPRADEINIL